MKHNKKKIGFFIFSIGILIAIILSVLLYSLLLQDGRTTYERDASHVHSMVAYYPDFFHTIFEDIFPFAMNCKGSQSECVEMTRQRLDLLSESTIEIAGALESSSWASDESYVKPSNQQPIYFIRLLPDGKIAKLFFSGKLVIEEVDNREERMVVELLEGKREKLYGPYFNAEVFISSMSPQRKWYDFKPAYLRDLYSQFEAIVPYSGDPKNRDGIVYLHGQ